MAILDNLVLGLDLGIASIGWGILNTAEQHVVDGGVWTFNAPETDKEKIPTNQIRQQARSDRKIIKRRRQRLNAVRGLLAAQSLIPDPGKHTIAINTRAAKISPWALRVAGLERQLTPTEFAITLYHVAKHRGFQSNRKGGDNTAPGEDQRALKAMEGLGEQIAPYRSFGEALCNDPVLSRRRRNMPDTYNRTPRRDWLRQEVALLFERQRQFGADFASPDFETSFEEVAFSQRAPQDQADHVGGCPFEATEKRASLQSPSFETFRFLQKLVNLRLYAHGMDDRALTSDEISTLESTFGNVAKFTYKAIRGLLHLDPNIRFQGINGDEENLDVATRNSGSAVGTRALREALGDIYSELDPAQLDDAMFAIAFHETNESVALALAKLDLPARAATALNAAVTRGDFSAATGAAHISAKACRAISTGLRKGLAYPEACQSANYDHTAHGASPLVQLRKDVAGLSTTEIRRRFATMLSDPKQVPAGSPVARKALIEGVKQFVAIINDHPAFRGNLPGRIHIEAARDVGKSAEERYEIQAGIDRRNRARDRAEKTFEAIFKRRPRHGSQELLIYELAEEQGWRCLYTGEPLVPSRLFDGASYQIDHILPWGRFGDDSFLNLSLCLAHANQAKNERTPYEWVTSGDADAPDLDAFLARVQACAEMKGKKKHNYTLKNAAEVEHAFRARNLNDTRWICKLFIQSLELFYPAEPGVQRLYVRPGALTSKVRRAWGLEHMKKDEAGNWLEDDRHHALHALSAAGLSDSVLLAASYAHQPAGSHGSAGPGGRFDPPWPQLPDQIAVALGDMIVARAEERRLNGQIHKDTVYGLDEATMTVFERTSPEKLLDQAQKDAEDCGWKLALEKRIPDPERSQAIIKALIDWQMAGRPSDCPPLGPTGDKIAKIRAVTTAVKPAVPVRGGTAKNSEMARVDVFSKPNSKGKKQYFMVPVYPHQVFMIAPPNKAVAAQKPQHLWPEMDASYQFECSLFRKCWIRVTKSDGEVIEGYFRGLNAGAGDIDISPHHSLQKENTRRGVGTRNLREVRKFQVSRLGKKYVIAGEQRTWRSKPLKGDAPL